ncbi:MAG: transcriptional regulator, AraC family [Clostridia bacterium]|nr:transcriptional regulator, AraC family [Clostridia bacterium]
MMAANAYENGFEAMAKHFKMLQSPLGNGDLFHFTTKSSGGWITQFHAAQGLFVSSMWFTPTQTLSYTFTIDKPCLWIFGIDSGDITFTQKGKASWHLTPINHVVINPQKSLKIAFPANVHTCCTCIFVFEDFFQKFLDGKALDKTFRIADAKGWTQASYNTPDLTLVLEQIKWSARNGMLPLFNYECKVGELLAIILKNIRHEKQLTANRRYHITWENEQKIWRIKTSIDLDILNPPTVEDLAMSEAMSISKLHRCFKQYYKMTILEYIHIEKMKRAMLMLASDDLSIKNIAHQCGYASASKFTSAFKEVHHITPSLYRKANFL